MVRSKNRVMAPAETACRDSAPVFTEKLEPAALKFVRSANDGLIDLFTGAFRALRRAAVRAGSLFVRLLKGLAAIFRAALRAGAKNPVRFLPALAAGLYAAVRRHKRFLFDLLNVAAPVAAAAVLLITVRFWTGATFALEIRMDGRHIGYVASESVFDDAKTKLLSRLLGDEEDFEFEPVYSLAIVSETDVQTANTLADEMLSTSAVDLTEAAGLYVDGRFVAACPSGDDVQAALDSFLEKESRQASGEAEFYSDVEVASGLYRPASVISCAALEQTLASGADRPVSVQVKKKVTQIREIAFSTVEVKDNTKDTSYKKVTSKGKLGKAEVTEEVLYIDGIESRRVVEKTEIIVKPVEKKIIVGTAEKPVTLAAQGDGIVTGTLAWPVQKVDRMYVSAYWGDGRGHRGVDIAAPTGTLVYAADGGKVVSVKTDARYGKYFVVDHGGNMQTLYAHCSEINVEVGQQVTRGQAIAKVGSTGRSTGPHLHFEVHIDGVQIDPAPYIGLK